MRRVPGDGISSHRLLNIFGDAVEGKGVLKELPGILGRLKMQSAGEGPSLLRFNGLDNVATLLGKEEPRYVVLKAKRYAERSWPLKVPETPIFLPD